MLSAVGKHRTLAKKMRASAYKVGSQLTKFEDNVAGCAAENGQLASYAKSYSSKFINTVTRRLGHDDWVTDVCVAPFGSRLFGSHCFGHRKTTSFKNLVSAVDQLSPCYSTIVHA